MLNEFIQFIRKENLFFPGQNVLLAVSGGLDSIVMADLFHRAGFSFAIAHCNFHLRGDESDRDEAFVRNLADHYKVRVFVRHFETAKYARQRKISIQVAARQLRYEWFDELLLKYRHDRLATAHHLDDQVETFLINLTRGTGIAGLHGIPVRQGKIIRPMLFTARKEIEAYAMENGLEFVEDSSNSSDKYTRNRIRRKVIPELEKINPAFRQALTETIKHIGDAETVYQNAIEEKRDSIFVAKGDVISVPVKEFYSLDPIAGWAYELLSPFGFNRANILDIISLKDAIPGKEIFSASHRLVRDREHLLIIPVQIPADEKKYSISAHDLHHDLLSPIHLAFEILDAPETYDDPAISAYLDLEKLEFPLTLRKWGRGDFFFPLGMVKPKKLSDFFIDLKYSKIEKENQWLLCSGKDIIWIIGKRIDDRYKIIKETSGILKITLLI